MKKMSKNIDETKINEWVMKLQERGYITDYHNIGGKKVLCLIRKKDFLLGRFYRTYVHIHGYDFSNSELSQLVFKLDLRDDLKELGIPYKEYGIRNARRILKETKRTIDEILARL